MRLHQYQVRERGFCGGLGESEFAHAPRCQRVETD